MRSLLPALITLAALPAQAGTTIITINPTQTLNSFSPPRDIGAGLDAQDTAAVPHIYQPSTIATMLTTGLGAISYRLYTELGVQNWHWNPSGSWSAAGAQGYFIGTATLGAPIENSFGYRLPDRGNTHDQANDDDYGRLTDGSATTFWKSNPYLSQAFTGESDTLHPQWVVADLGGASNVDAVSLNWVEPRAVDYQIQYWVGGNPFNNPAGGNWQNFPQGVITNGAPGQTILQIAAAPIKMRFLRALMTRSSGLCGTHGSSDIRNCVGYALAEIGIGTLANGVFTDLVNHAPNQSQTNTTVSSTDPWNSAADRNQDGTEQAGLDRVFQSGITRNIPATVPIAMLYGTPENASAELQYLEAQHYPIARVEMGEEPDGQYILPEDYGALYLQFATALHAVDPTLQLGGPVFQGGTTDVQTWPDASGNVSWLNRFLNYLAAHGRSADLAFMSFEHYPFNPCGSLQQNLIDEPGQVAQVINIWHQDGLPATTPIYITELNYSAAFTEVPQQIEGALWMGDFFGSLFSNGAAGAFLYEYEPEPLFAAPGCGGQYGNLTMFPVTQHSMPLSKSAQYFAAQLLTQQWAEPIDAAHTLLPVVITTTNPTPFISAYALRRPDGQTAILVINRDLQNPQTISVNFSNGAQFSGDVTQISLSPAQYVWHETGAHGAPSPDGPLGISSSPAQASYTLPAASMVVLRGVSK